MDRLFSQKTTEVEAGLGTVEAWRIRGNVPAPVESTADLLRVVGDMEVHRRADVRLLLSMAIIRMVNGLLDPAQKRTHAISIASLAENKAMPRLLVDIRHEATHKRLPSLELLQIAAEKVRPVSMPT